MNDRALAELRALAERDGELAATAGRLREADTEAAAIRAGAESVAAFVDELAEQRTRRGEAMAAAQREAQARHSELERAEEALAAARDDESRDDARRAAARAADRASTADGKLERARASLDELEDAATDLPAVVGELERRAEELAWVCGSPGDLVEWAARVHSELFVSFTQIDTERQRLIREANELASMLLGEATYGSTAAQALAQVERYWTSSPGQVSESR